MIIEFALLLIFFLVIVFGIIDMARLMFLYNTLQDATRRAARSAAVTSPGDSAAMDSIRQAAIFRNTPGGLILKSDLTDKAIRIDFLSVARAGDGTLGLQSMNGSAVPSSSQENEVNCRIDPYGNNCIRFVRVRVCDPSNPGSCVPVKFRTTIPFIVIDIDLPIATTISHVQSLGYKPN